MSFNQRVCLCHVWMERYSGGVKSETFVYGVRLYCERTVRVRRSETPLGLRVDRVCCGAVRAASGTTPGPKEVVPADKGRCSPDRTEAALAAGVDRAVDLRWDDA